MTDETGVDELQIQFGAWMDEALAKLNILQADGADIPAQSWVNDVYDIAHNIKGVGSSFGFPLLSDAGTSLCRYIKAKPDGLDWSRSTFDAHIKVFNVIYAEKIGGSGGSLGTQLIAKLEQRVGEALETP